MSALSEMIQVANRPRTYWIHTVLDQRDVRLLACPICDLWT